MATATLTSLLTDIATFDATSPTTHGTGNANAAANEAELQIEGTGCAAVGQSGAVGAVSPATSDFVTAYATVTSFTGASKHLHVWLRVLYPVHNAADGGVSLYLFDSTNEGLWFVTGADEGYNGAWYHHVENIDGTSGRNADLLYGATEPAMTGITRIGIGGNITATKGESFLQNHYFDIARVTNTGDGFRVTGGTGTGASSVKFQDIHDADTVAYSIFLNKSGAFVCEGEIQFGNAASTCYVSDSLQTVLFADHPVSSTYYQIIGNDGTTGVTNIDFSDIVWKGVSRAIPFKFDMSALSTGDTGSFVNQTFIFGDLLKFGGQSTVTNCTFVECATVFPNGITFTTCSFTNSDAITLTTASDLISGGSTNLHNTAINVAFVTTNDLTKITNHNFDNTGGTGHAIELTATGTYTFSGNQFTGYGADASSSAAIYNNSGGAVTINISGGGSTPTIRNGTSATTTVNNTVTVRVTAIKASDASTIQNARVYLTADTGGPLAQGTIILNGLTNASGVIEDTGFNFTSNQPVTGRVRKSTTTPLFKTSNLSGTIISSGLLLQASMIGDE
jgi:hypothetical protein